MGQASSNPRSHVSVVISPAGNCWTCRVSARTTVCVAFPVTRTRQT